MADTLELIGGVLIVVGLALWAFPLALVVTGLFLVAAAWSLPPLHGNPAARGSTTARAGRR